MPETPSSSERLNGSLFNEIDRALTESTDLYRMSVERRSSEVVENAVIFNIMFNDDAEVVTADDFTRAVDYLNEFLKDKYSFELKSTKEGGLEIHLTRKLN